MDTERGRTGAIVAVFLSSLAIVLSLRPLWVAAVPFLSSRNVENVNYKRKPTLTNFLNLICIICVILLFTFYLVLECVAFFGFGQLNKITGYSLVMTTGVLYFFQAITTFTFVLVVIDRFRIFGEIIKYPRYTIQSLLCASVLVLLISLGGLVFQLIYRMKNPDDYGRIPFYFDFLNVLIQLYTAVLDIVITTRIVWVFLARLYKLSSSKANAKSSIFTLSLKTQVILLLVLMIVMDIAGILVAFDPANFFKGMYLIGQYIGATFFAFHIVIGLTVLLRLKVAVINESAVIADDLPSIQMENKLVDSIPDERLLSDSSSMVSKSTTGTSPSSSLKDKC